VAKDHVHRNSLLDRLEKNLHRPLTLVSAPAGYGKSTLLSCWLESSDTSSAWVSLDEKDNDLNDEALELLEGAVTLAWSDTWLTRPLFPGCSKRFTTCAYHCFRWRIWMREMENLITHRSGFKTKGEND